MSKYTVWIVPSPENSWRCLEEVAKGVTYSLSELGHEVDYVPACDPLAISAFPGRLVVFNAHCLPLETTLGEYQLPDDAILFNAEQVQCEGELGAAWRNSWYVRRLRAHEVWDYSATNVERLANLGVYTKLCPVGYWPGLSDIPEANQGTTNQDIDVLFIGSLNPRRQNALMSMAQRKLVTRVVFGSYGEERNNLIARAKVVLNVHFYPNPIWEIFRCSHLLANGKCVVSEAGGTDAELEALADATTAYVPYEKLAETCESLVRDPLRREAMAWRGREAFMKRDQVEYVKRALAGAVGATGTR